MSVAPQRVLEVKSDRVCFFHPTKNKLLSLIIYPRILFTLAAHFCPQVDLLMIVVPGEHKVKGQNFKTSPEY